MTNQRSTRRQFLKGAGGAIVALPTLVSLLPRAARANVTPPKRFVFFFHPNGVDTNSFWPSGTENAFTLGSNMSALEPWRPHMLWTGGLNMRAAYEAPTGWSLPSLPGEQHQRGAGALLTGHGLNTGSFVGNDGTSGGYARGISLDQSIMGVIGTTTPIGSLQLGVNTRVRDVSGVVSYRGNNAPNIPEIDPRQTYRSMFFTPGRAETPTHVLRRKSILDAVVSQIGSMKTRASMDDVQKLDEHLSMVRDLEKRLAYLPETPVPSTPGPSGSTGVTGYPGTPGGSGPVGGAARNYDGCSASDEPILTDDPESADAMPEMAHLQLELAALALRCDLTRVITIVFADAQDKTSMPFLGVQSKIHDLSHLSDSDPNRAGLRARDAWQADRFVHMMSRLNGAIEGDGTSVLDNSLLMWGSELSRGNTHSHIDMPFVFAGHALGWRTNRYLRFSNRDHNDLLLSIFLGFGGSGTTYGDPKFGSGELTGLV